MAKDAKSTPEEMPSTFCARHNDFPELKDKKLGDIVEITVKGRVVGMHAEDKYTKGSTDIQIEGGDRTENYDDMSAEEMRKKLPVKDEEAD